MNTHLGSVIHTASGTMYICSWVNGHLYVSRFGELHEGIDEELLAVEVDDMDCLAVGEPFRFHVAGRGWVRSTPVKRFNIHMVR